MGIRAPENLGACMALTAFAKAMSLSSQCLSFDLGMPVKVLGIGKRHFAHCMTCIANTAMVNSLECLFCR